MSFFAEKREMSLKRLGKERAVNIANAISKIVVEDHLSICQAEAVFEIVIDFLKAYPLNGSKTEVPQEQPQNDNNHPN